MFKVNNKYHDERITLLRSRIAVLVGLLNTLNYYNMQAQMQIGYFIEELRNQTPGIKHDKSEEVDPNRT